MQPQFYNVLTGYRKRFMMALSIKDEQTDRMVRQYARLHGTSYTGAIKRAVGDALEREGQPLDRDRKAEDFRAFVKQIQAEIAAAPTLDSRPIDELLYDKEGLPI